MGSRHSPMTLGFLHFYIQLVGSYKFNTPQHTTFISNYTLLTRYLNIVEINSDDIN